MAKGPPQGEEGGGGGGGERGTCASRLSSSCCTYSGNSFLKVGSRMLVSRDCSASRRLSGPLAFMEPVVMSSDSMKLNKPVRMVPTLLQDYL